VPRVSEFYGIVIRMFYSDHPPLHFHVTYGEHRAVVGVDPIEIVSGRLPVRAQRLVFEWASFHQAELTENWHRARRGEALTRIAPLD
jgi:hypothetical protein